MSERRCYTEGNALDAQASKEDMLDSEQFSPVVVDLQAFRDEVDWMDEDYIKKNPSRWRSSPEVCALSAVGSGLQLGHHQPGQALEEHRPQPERCGRHA